MIKTTGQYQSSGFSGAGLRQTICGGLFLGATFLTAMLYGEDAPQKRGANSSEKAYQVERNGPLKGPELDLNQFKSAFHSSVTHKDGILYRDGKPCFLFGSQISGGQWNQKLLFLARLGGDNYIDISAGPVRHFYSQQEEKRLSLRWEREPFVLSMANQAAAQGLFTYLDLGGGGAGNLSFVPEHLDRYKLPGAQDWRDQCSEYFGHFYPIDLNSKLGQDFYLGAFDSYLRYFEGNNAPVVGVELRNELGVFSFSPQALEDFRAYLGKKYGDLAKLNQICGTSFATLKDVIPPFLFDDSIAALVREHPFHRNWSLWTQALAKAKESHPQLYNDWIEFTRIRFADGFSQLADGVRQRYGNRFPITIQSRMERTSTENYQTVDMESIANDLDFWGQQISNVLFFHYEGKPATIQTVKEAMNRLTLYPDFGRGICSKPIWNTECIVEGSFPAENNLDHMLKQSIVPMHVPWRYQVDPENVGEKEGWYALDFNDAKWPELPMPNLRTHHKVKNIVGRSWFRFPFHVDDKYQRERDYAFKRFMLYIGSIIPTARIYMNGQLLYVGGGQNKEILINVSDHLHYGRENILAIAIDNPDGYAGLEGPIALVDADDLKVKRPVDSGQTAALFWQHAVHGHSGLNFWRVKQPPLNPEVIRTRLAIESVADVLLPRPRIKGKVALLYPIESFGGIVRRPQDMPEFSEFMNFYSSLIFHQIPVDVVSCKGILEGKHEGYQCLVIPMARMVRKGVFERVLAFAKKGGTVVLTHDSLIQDDHFYKALPLEKLIGKTAMAASKEKQVKPSRITNQVGEGKVEYLGSASDFDLTHRKLGKVLKAAGVEGDVSVDLEKSEEFPFLETQIIGKPSRFLVYMMNWGGMSHRGKLRIRREFLQSGVPKYRVRTVRGTGKFNNAQYSLADLQSGINIEVSPQDPLVLLFEVESLEPIKLHKPAPERMKVLDQILSMQERKPVNPKKPAVLFLDTRAASNQEHGKIGSPILVDLLEKAGCAVHQRFVSELSEDNLKQFQAIIIQEDYQSMWVTIDRSRPEFWGMLRSYMEDGGSILLAGTLYAGWNAQSVALNRILKPYGISSLKRYPRDGSVWLEDPAHSVSGDPLDISLTNISKHPVTQDVKNVHLLCATEIIDKEGRLQALVSSHPTDRNRPSKPVISSGTFGKGRLIVSGEPYFPQPFRIEQGDNLKLTWNILRWLLHENIDDLSKEELNSRLLFREQDVERWEAEETR